jgi:hypothetical protein
MSDEIYLKIECDHSNGAQSFYHEIKKQARDGQRYGVNIDVERVKLEETETGFKKANE